MKLSVKSTKNILLIILFITSCSTNKNENLPPKPKFELCNKDSIYQEILQTREIQFLSNNLKENFNSGISFLIPDSIISKDSTICIMVGYNGPDRWENYYTFYVRIGSCEIFVDDDSLEYLSLMDWDRLKEKEYQEDLYYNKDQDIYIEIKPTKLPFNYGKWEKWVDENEKYGTIPTTGPFFHYSIDNNQYLRTIIKDNKLLHEGLELYLYFLLYDSTEYSSYLLFSYFKHPTISQEILSPKFFDIINIKDGKIISTLNVGDLPLSPKKNRISFNIDEKFIINIYEEKMDHWNTGPFPVDTIKKETYQIQDDGKIVKIE